MVCQNLASLVLVSRLLPLTHPHSLLHLIPSRHQTATDVVSKVMEALGHIDVLVNNASIQHYRESLTDITPEQLEATFRTNVFGYFFMAQVRWRRGRGKGGRGTGTGEEWGLGWVFQLLETGGMGKGPRRKSKSCVQS